MEIFAAQFDYDFSKPLHFEDKEGVLLMDRLPQEGIGSLYIRTFELGSEDPIVGHLVLDACEIEQLKELDCLKDEPALKRAVEKIIQYATANPKDDYMFVIFE
ncbi:hypothetical protein HYZ99_04235 [Candidatus Peregrinibacteria bacterium]|nr:hypothetical protein [Candidatus Peregrinibacteria bacterium]